ncbi:hypothetical protein MZM54_05245 [[Brevibacterium] frigoritolerans]|nr:hypothetical protein [Peribacillus frigoritolerans]
MRMLGLFKKAPKNDPYQAQIRETMERNAKRRDKIKNYALSTGTPASPNQIKHLLPRAKSFIIYHNAMMPVDRNYEDLAEYGIILHYHSFSFRDHSNYENVQLKFSVMAERTDLRNGDVHRGNHSLGSDYGGIQSIRVSEDEIIIVNQEHITIISLDEPKNYSYIFYTQ